jgi:hypothetical protein
MLPAVISISIQDHLLNGHQVSQDGAGLYVYSLGIVNNASLS